jgi:hypothetical protein
VAKDGPKVARRATTERTEGEGKDDDVLSPKTVALLAGSSATCFFSAPGVSIADRYNIAIQFIGLARARQP